MNVKKLVALLLSVCAILTACVLPAFAVVRDEQGREKTLITVNTPAGSLASAALTEGDANPEEIAEELNIRARFGRLGAEYLTETNIHFNCFSFAFLNQDVNNNNIWLDSIDEFLNDGSYVEIDKPVQGCIAVWCNDNHVTEYTTLYNADGTTSSEVFAYPDEVLYTHAAIVIGVNPGEDGVLQPNEIEMLSKWGKGGVYRHTQAACDYNTNPGRTLMGEVKYTDPATKLLRLHILIYGDCYDISVRYFVPNPALYENQTLKTGRTNRKGLYKDSDGIRYYVRNEAYAAGVVSDANGHYYYIDSSLKAVKNNAAVQIPLNKTNGLIPDGVYSIDSDGYITNLPTVLAGESIRNGVVKMADGQIKTMENGYPTAGLGAYTDGTDYYYFDDTPIQIGTYADGTYDFTMLTTDGHNDGTVSGAKNNGILPEFAWTVDENGKITNLPTKLDSQSKNFGTGLMRLPDNTIVLYSNGTAMVNATGYTDPATGAKYVFTYGGTTYSTTPATTLAKTSLTNRLAKKAA